MSNEFHEKIWSPELAARVEGDLRRILEPVPTVFGLRGCSYNVYRDFKICFEHTGSAKPTYSYFLEYDPEEAVLRAWPGGLPYKFPDDVREHISNTFPHAEYRISPGPGIDGFHLWNNVPEISMTRPKLASNISN